MYALSEYYASGGRYPDAASIACKDSDGILRVESSEVKKRMSRLLTYFEYPLPCELTKTQSNLVAQLGSIHRSADWNADDARKLMDKLRAFMPEGAAAHAVDGADLFPAAEKPSAEMLKKMAADQLGDEFAELLETFLSAKIQQS